MSELEQKISNLFRGASVKDIVIDEEFGNVTATIDDKRNVDCGFVEDFK